MQSRLHLLSPPSSSLLLLLLQLLLSAAAAQQPELLGVDASGSLVLRAPPGGDVIVDGVAFGQVMARLEAVEAQLRALAPPGTVVVAGGLDAGSTPLAAATRFHPASAGWQPLPDLPAARWAQAMGQLDGQVYCLGGSGTAGGEPTDTVFRVPVDAAPSAQWEQLSAALPQPQREGVTATVNGSLLLLGGKTGDAQLQRHVLRYRAGATAWQALAPMPVALRFPSVAVYLNEVFVFGGAAATDIGSDTSTLVHRLSLASNTWRTFQAPENLAFQPNFGRFVQLGAVVLALDAFDPAKPGDVGLQAAFDLEGGTTWRVAASLARHQVRPGWRGPRTALVTALDQLYLLTDEGAGDNRATWLRRARRDPATGAFADDPAFGFVLPPPLHASQAPMMLVVA